MSGAIVISARGLTGSFRALGSTLTQAAVKGLRRAAYDFDAEVVRQIDASTPPPVNLGQLKRERRVTATQDGAVHELYSPQAKWMEFGTRPHWAPLPPLLAWAQQKARGGGVDAYALAKGAQRSIALRGTRARRFWGRAIAKLPDIVRKRLAEALAQAKVAA